jgi:hypothetical protein
MREAKARDDAAKAEKAATSIQTSIRAKRARSDFHRDTCYCVQCGCRVWIADGHAEHFGVSVDVSIDMSSVITAKSKTVKTGEAFAHAVFRDADKNGDGSLTKTEIRKYFKTHPIEKAHILGPDFKWKVFFTRMDKDGDAQFDIDEFTEAVSKVYHVDMFTESTFRSQSQVSHFYLKCM